MNQQRKAPTLSHHKEKKRDPIIDFFPTHHRGSGWYYYHPRQRKMIGPFDGKTLALDDYYSFP